MKAYDHGGEAGFSLERTPPISGLDDEDSPRSDDDIIGDAYGLYKNLGRLPLINDSLLVITGGEVEIAMQALAYDSARTKEVAQSVRTSIGWLGIRGLIGFFRHIKVEDRTPHVMRRLAADLDADAMNLQLLNREVRHVVDSIPPEPRQ